MSFKDDVIKEGQYTYRVKVVTNDDGYKATTLLLVCELCGRELLNSMRVMNVPIYNQELDCIEDHMNMCFIKDKQYGIL